jgi:hypothetical protein
VCLVVCLFGGEQREAIRQHGSVGGRFWASRRPAHASHCRAEGRKTEAFAGYVACNSKKDTLYICWRGTVFKEEWVADANVRVCVCVSVCVCVLVCEYVL